MDRETRLGILTPYASRGGYLSCHFAADPAFAAIQPLFEEAYSRMKNRLDWEKPHEQVAALGLTLLREDGMRMELNALRIHEEEASFCLSKERIVWDKQVPAR